MNDVNNLSEDDVKTMLANMTPIQKAVFCVNSFGQNVYSVMLNDMREFVDKQILDDAWIAFRKILEVLVEKQTVELQEIEKELQKQIQ